MNLTLNLTSISQAPPQSMVDMVYHSYGMLGVIVFYAVPISIICYLLWLRSKVKEDDEL
jgi:hypothetical protein